MAAAAAAASAAAGRAGRSSARDGAVKMKEVWEKFRSHVRSFALRFEAPLFIPAAANPILQFITQQEDQKVPTVPSKIVFASPVHPLWLRAFFHALAVQPSVFAPIKTLCIAHGDLGDVGASYVAQGLLLLPTIVWVELIDCMVGPLGCKALGDMLGEHKKTQLFHLSLDHNPVGDEGAAALAAGLARNTRLRRLSLAYCGIGAAGAKALGRALQWPDSGVRTLSLEGNALGQAGVQEVAKAIWVGQHLAEVNLATTSFANGSHTEADLVGLASLLYALRHSTVCARLDIRGNPIGDAGLRLVLDNVADLAHVQALDVTEKVDPAMYAQLLEIVKRNQPKKVVKRKKKKKPTFPF